MAVAKELLEHVHADILCLEQVCSANKSLINILKSPVIKGEKKLAILQALFQDKVHNITLSFFAMVTQRHREALLPTMAQAFLAQYDQHQGIKRAQVATTFPLSNELDMQLQQTVQQIAPCKKVILNQKIDPALIGGYMLQVEDKRLDQSLRKKLLKLRKSYVIEGY